MNNKTNNNFSLRKLLLTAFVAGPLATLPAPLWALPDVSSTNLTKSAGVDVLQVGLNTLNISAPNKAVLTWGAFGSGASTIAAADTLNYIFSLPTDSALNYVSGGAATTIDGKILSNGNVYLLNPAGIVISSTARITTGGFYASTIGEPPSFFSVNGNLSFTGTSPTASVTVAGTGAVIEAVGTTGNNIYLVGKEVDVQGGAFYGNLFVKTTGTANSLAGGTASVSFGGSGAVSVNQTNAGNPIGGALNITTSGGAVSLTGAGGGLTVNAPTAGALTVNTTGTTLNGAVLQTAVTRVVADATGSTVSIVAGDASKGLTSGNINLTNVDFQNIAANGQNVEVRDIDGLALAASTATGTLLVQVQGGNDLTSAGATAATGNVSLLSATGRTVTFSGSGNITFAALPNTSTINLTATGDITLLPSVGAPTITQNVSINSTGGSITGQAGVALNPSNTLTLSATSTGGKISVPATSSRTATITANSDITIATGITGTTTTNLATPISITSTTGNISVGTITSNTTVSLTATAGSITATGAITNTTLNLTANNGSISLQGVTTTGGTATISGGSVTAAGAVSSSTVTITATTGSISLTTLATTSAATLNANASGGTVTATGLTSTSTAATTINSNGSVVIPTATVPTLVVNSATGSITQGGIITSTSKVTLNAATDIALTTAGNNFTNVVLQGGTASNSFQVTDSSLLTPDVIVGTATNAKAPTVITAGTNGILTLGAAAGDSIAFGSNLTLATSGTGTIATSSNTVNVFGSVTLNTAGGNVQLGNAAFGALSNYRFGQIIGNLGAGNLTVVENTTLNLGAITANNVNATSLDGDIVNSGALNLAGTATVASNSLFNPGTVTLNNAFNAITGAVLVSNAKDFSLTNTKATTVTVGTTANGRAVSGTTSVTVTGGAANTLTISNANGGDLGTVSFSAPGNVNVTETGVATGLTLQNVAATGAATVVNVTASGPITLGSGIALSNGGGTNITSTGASADIKDSASNIRINGAASFTSDNSITIGQAGHSLGAVSLVTTGVNGANGTANVTYTESGSANLNNVSINNTNNAAVPVGNLIVSSTAGDIIQAGTIVVRNPGAAASNTTSFTSATGRVALTAAGNSFALPVTVSAAGNTSIVSSEAIALGNVSSGGFLTVDTSAGAAKAITQLAGTTVKAFGATTLNTQGGKITVSQTGNNFGGLTLASNLGAAAAGADIELKESGTINFVSVASGTAGKLIATSDTGSIIQSGTAGVVVGGTSALSAPGGIALNSGTANNFGGANVSLTTAGNAAIQDVNLTTSLGNISVGGTLTVRNNNGAGLIKDSPGTINVGGVTTFDAGTTGASSIRIDSSTASFGPIVVRAGTGVVGQNAVVISESAAMVLNPGSIVVGSVTLISTTGSITTAGSGGGTFQNSLSLSANGNITITNPIFVQGGLSLRSLGAIDVKALSKTGNLNNITPTVLPGFTSYAGPTD